MSANVTPQSASPSQAELDWDAIAPPTDLIFDDGEPLESNRHRIGMNLLIRSLQQAWSDRDDYFTGGNMFVYYSRTQARNRDFRGPDFFVTLNVDGTRSRQGWVVWEENGRYPDVIVELMSSSTASIDTGVKKEIYAEIFRTPDYFVYDPFEVNSLQGWHLDGTLHYQPIQPNERGWLWCERLGFWLGIWEGTCDRETAPWLRFYYPDGSLVLLPEEAERQRADEVQQRADEVQQRADEAQRRTDEAQQRAGEAQRRADRLAQLLRERGIDPDELNGE